MNDSETLIFPFFASFGFVKYGAILPPAASDNSVGSEILMPSELYQLSPSLYPTTAVGLFTNNPEVINYGTKYLQITALMEPVYPIFFISNALIQGLKKANIVMFLTLGRMVIMPLIVLTYLIFYLESSFEYVFWGLLIINWVFGIFVFILTKYIIKKESQNNETIKQTA